MHITHTLFIYIYHFKIYINWTNFTYIAIQIKKVNDALHPTVSPAGITLTPSSLLILLFTFFVVFIVAYLDLTSYSQSGGQDPKDKACEIHDKKY